jgi:amino acid transporter
LRLLRALLQALPVQPAEPLPAPILQPLRRALGVVGILFLTLSAITPASSVFIIVPEMLKDAGTGALWAMLIAGVVCVATAYLYAELSSAWPVAGGEYVMVAHTLGPLAGFVVLGVNTVNNFIFPAVVGLGLSDVLSVVVPGLRPVPVAVAMVVACALVSVLRIRFNAWLTGLFLAVELAALATLFVLGLLDPVRSLTPMLLHPATAAGAATAGGIGLATTVAIFALNGYGNAVYLAEEMHDPARRIARVILLALLLTLFVEIAPLAAVLIGAPDLTALFASADPFGLFVATRGSATLAGWVALGVAVAIVNAAIACIISFARFFYSTGRDRAWGRPFDRWATAVHPRFGTPWIATLIVGAIGTAACFVPLPLLLVLSGAGIGITYLAMAFAALAGRRNGASDHAPYRMPLFPLAPLVTIGALLYVFWTNWGDLKIGRPGLIATAAQMLVSAAYYILVVKRRGPWIVRDPIDDTPAPAAVPRGA